MLLRRSRTCERHRGRIVRACVSTWLRIALHEAGAAAAATPRCCCCASAMSKGKFCANCTVVAALGHESSITNSARSTHRHHLAAAAGRGVEAAAMRRQRSADGRRDVRSVLQLRLRRPCGRRARRRRRRRDQLQRRGLRALLQLLRRCSRRLLLLRLRACLAVQQPPQRRILSLQLRGTRLRAMRGVSERAVCNLRNKAFVSTSRAHLEQQQLGLQRVE